jgi:uncharacterized protein HemY
MAIIIGTAMMIKMMVIVIVVSVIVIVVVIVIIRAMLINLGQGLGVHTSSIRQDVSQCAFDTKLAVALLEVLAGGRLDQSVESVGKGT